MSAGTLYPTIIHSFCYYYWNYNPSPNCIFCQVKTRQYICTNIVLTYNDDMSMSLGVLPQCFMLGKALYSNISSLSSLKLQDRPGGVAPILHVVHHVLCGVLHPLPVLHHCPVQGSLWNTGVALALDSEQWTWCSWWWPHNRHSCRGVWEYSEGNTGHAR